MREFLFGPGDKLGDHIVTKQLARGGLSEVYIVRDDDEIGINSVLKIAIPPKHFSEEEVGARAFATAQKLTPYERCRHEAMILRNLRHPYIIRPQSKPLLRDLPHGTAGLLLEEIHGAKTLAEVIDDLSWQPWTAQQLFTRDEAAAEMITEKYLPPRQGRRSLLMSYMAGLDFASLKRLLSTHMSDEHRTEGQHPLSPDARESFEELRTVLRKHFQGEDQGMHPYGPIQASIEGELKPLREKYQSIPLKIEQVALYLRSEGILHKDLHKKNILVDRNLDVKVLDFGMAGPPEEDSWGSRSVMPPELHLGHAHQNSDLWAAGIIAYEMAFGEPPFKGTSAAVAEQVAKYANAAFATHPSGTILPFSTSELPSLMDAYLDCYVQGLPATAMRCAGDDPPLSRSGKLKVSDDPTTKYAELRRAEEYLRLFCYLAVNPEDRTKERFTGAVEFIGQTFFDYTQGTGTPASMLCEDLGLFLLTRRDLDPESLKRMLMRL